MSSARTRTALNPSHAALEQQELAILIGGSSVGALGGVGRPFAMKAFAVARWVTAPRMVKSAKSSNIPVVVACGPPALCFQVRLGWLLRLLAASADNAAVISSDCAGISVLLFERG